MHSDWVCLLVAVGEGDLIVMQVGDVWLWCLYA